MRPVGHRPRLWVAGDWNGFFGLLTNVVLNVIVLTGLCLHVVNLPAGIVYGRILPALGIALPLRNLYNTWLAWRLAKKEGRDDGTAVPLGIHNFTEGMNNVASAAVAGDDYDLRRILIAAFVIDRQFERTAIYATAAAILSYFGFIHDTSLGIGASAPMALGYVPIAAICPLLSRWKHATSITVVEPGVVET